MKPQITQADRVRDGREFGASKELRHEAADHREFHPLAACLMLLQRSCGMKPQITMPFRR